MKALVAALGLAGSCLVLPAVAQTGKDPAVFAGTALTSDTGETVRLSDFRGKMVFVNFWGDWCPPCRDDMPLLQKMQTALRGDADRIEYVFVSIKPDWFNRDSAKFRELGMVGHNYNWEPRTDAQWNAFLGDPPGNTSYFVPTTYALDAAGNVTLMRAQTVPWKPNAEDVRAILTRN